MIRNGSLKLAIAAFFGLASVATAAAVHAAVGYIPASSGWDVSWPQCNSSLPAGGEFAIVGLNYGVAFSQNPCFEEQLAWADSLPYGASLYVNLGNPGPLSEHWPCSEVTPASDTACAYEYGSDAATYSLDALASMGIDPLKYHWWLDIETVNSWDGGTSANAASIQGYLNRLAQDGVTSVGIYSTSYQWSVIAGDFSPGLGVWVAGASNANNARLFCNSGFAGGRVVLVQYPDSGFDGNRVCGDTGRMVGVGKGQSDNTKSRQRNIPERPDLPSAARPFSD